METRRRRRRSKKSNLDFEKTDSRPSSRRGAGCIIGISALVLIAAIALFIIPLWKEADTPAQSEDTDPPLNDATWNGPLPMEVIRHFEKATTIEDKLAHLYRPDHVGKRAKIFFSEGPGSTEKVIRIAKTQGQGNTINTLRFVAILESGESRMIALRLKDGEAKIDFDLYSQG